MTSDEAWARRLARANARATIQLEADLRREFARVAEEWVVGVRRDRLIDRHEIRLRQIFALHLTAVQSTFGAFAREMISEAKADDAAPPAEDASAMAALEAAVASILAGVVAATVAREMFRDPQIAGAARQAVIVARGDIALAGRTLAAQQAIRGAATRSAALIVARGALEAAPDERPILRAEPVPPPPAPPPPPPPAVSEPPPPQSPPESFSERVARYVRQHGETRPRKLAESTRAIVNSALAQAALKGGGEEGAQRAVREALNQTIGPRRARTIARTEIGAAQNAASLEIARERGLRLRKRWVAIGDERTRPGHAEADGQERDLDEPFDVAGEALMHPGDPKGRPGNIINCRCAMIIRAAR